MRKRRKRLRPRIRVPVASMGDIAFLLIIFFMVCSNFSESNVALVPPVSADVARLERSMVSVSVDRYGVIRIQGLVVAGPEGVEPAVAALLEGREDRTVLLKCDRDLDRRAYEPVIAAIARAGGVIGAVGERGGGAR